MQWSQSQRLTNYLGCSSRTQELTSATRRATGFAAESGRFIKGKHPVGKPRTNGLYRSSVLTFHWG